VGKHHHLLIQEHTAKRAKDLKKGFFHVYSAILGSICMSKTKSYGVAVMSLW
jgi:hypothetical protein